MNVEAHHAETATEAARARLAALARDREHLGRGDIAYIFDITLRAAESRVRYELAHAAEVGADAYPGERVPLVPLPDVRIEQGPRRTLRFWTPAAVDRFLGIYGAEASDANWRRALETRETHNRYTASRGSDSV